MNTENLDKEEILKFDSIASSWWDKEGEFKPLHQINPLRVNYLKEKVELSGKKILDIGCGGGILAESLREEGSIVTAIDASEKTINVAKTHAKKIKSDVTYINSTVEEYIEKGLEGEFDVITCLEMLEHVPNPPSIIKSCKKLMKPGGHIFFSTINRNPKSYLFAIIGAEYILNLLPKGTHEYSKFIKPSELANWIRRNNLELRDTRGMSYNPLTDNYWLGNDMQVNYFMHAMKLNDEEI